MTNEKIKGIGKFFSNLFTETSSFEQLYEHSDMIHNTVEALVEELKAYSQGKPVEGEEVSNLEFQADQKKQEIRHELPRSDLLMPVARSDLLSLLWNQDEIADNSQDVAELLPMLELKADLPSQYINSLEELGELLESSVEEYGKLIRKAGDHIQGKSGDHQPIEVIFNSIEKINEIEHQADRTTRQAIKAVYSSEELEDIEKYHLIQVVLKINNTLDHVENAGNFIRIMTNK